MHKKIVVAILALSFFLRVFQLTSDPPSLYWEEAALGYDAYSILKTGKDHHGHPFPIVAFESFGDYKPSGYFYSIVPFILIFGLSPLAVRLPSAFAGVALVYCIGKIAQELFPKSEMKRKLTIVETLTRPDVLAMIATAFSPWALQFSRAGWEANLATCWLTIGVYWGLLGIKKMQFRTETRRDVLTHYFLCVLFLVLSTYTYHSTRFIAPVLGIVLTFPLILHIRQYWKVLVVLGVTATLLMLPLLMDARDPTVLHRLQETSAFTTQSEVTQSNALIQQFGNTRLAKIVFHRNWFYAKTVLINIFQHFRLDFLFLSGDNNARHSTHFFGLLFPTDLFVLIFGAVAIFSKWRKKYYLLLIWLFIGLTPAAITKDIPHALRTLPVLPVYMLVLGIGAANIFEQLKQLPFTRLTQTLVVIIFTVQVVVFWHFYLFVYPTTSSKEWQYGYQQMVEAVQKNLKQDEKIYITTEYGRPAMYYWFFTKTDPTEVQAEDKIAIKDQGEFKTYKQFSFSDYLSGDEKGLIASTPNQRQHFANAKELVIVNDLQGKPLWVIYRNE